MEAVFQAYQSRNWSQKFLFAIVAVTGKIYDVSSNAFGYSTNSKRFILLLFTYVTHFRATAWKFNFVI